MREIFQKISPLPPQGLLGRESLSKLTKGVVSYFRFWALSKDFTRGVEGVGVLSCCSCSSLKAVLRKVNGTRSVTRCW